MQGCFPDAHISKDDSVFNVVFHSKKSDKDLNEMIPLCCDVDMFTHKMSQTVNLAMGAALQLVMAISTALK